LADQHACSIFVWILDRDAVVASNFKWLQIVIYSDCQWDDSIQSALHLLNAQTGQVNLKWQVFGLRCLNDGRELWQAQAIFIADVRLFGCPCQQPKYKKQIHFVVVEIPTLLYLAFIQCMNFALGEDLPVMWKYNWLGARLQSHDNQFILRWLSVLEHIQSVTHKAST